MSSMQEILTNKFLEKHLKPYLENSLGLLNVDIVNAFANGENYSSELLRVRVAYSSKDGRNQILSLIAKSAMKLESMKSDAKELNFHDCEFNIYCEMLPEIYKAGFTRKIGPEVYYASSFPTPMILLEDLTPLHYKMQCRHEGLDLEHCLVALDKLAYFHAASVLLYEKNPKLMEKYNKGMYYNNKEMEFLLTIFCKELVNLCETVPSLQKYYKKLNAIEDIEKKICMAGKPSKKFNVLNHGDFWCNNILFRYTPNGKVDDAVLIDFQMSFFSSPVLDLHHFLTTSLNGYVKDKHVHTILNFYFDKLISNLNELRVDQNVNREELFNEFKDCAFVALGDMSFGLPLVKASRRKDAQMVTYLTEHREGSFRHHCFNNPMYIKELEYLLPFYDNLGIFDL
ncbi:hypothetical protein FQA39_LY02864 [Lamprigera yunnana]|nr:hypothetical protein FQA39_LY02864 [Lamprigera yunnana]